MQRWAYPVIKYSGGQVRTCCRTFPNEVISDEMLLELGINAFINSPELQQRRLEMLSGIRHPSCKSCWKLEVTGVKSFRSKVEDFTRYIHEREGGPNDFSEIVRNKEKYLMSTKPQMLEIQIDNICDLKCIYCNEEYSSRWESENKMDAGYTPSAHTMTKDSSPLFKKTFWSWFQSISSDLKCLNLIGGEPTLSPKFYEILDKLLSDEIQCSPHLVISIVSNFNSNESRFNKFTSYLSRLSKKYTLSIDASCEALSKRGEFIRQGLDWEIFQKNVNSMVDVMRSIPSENRNHNFGIQVTNNILSVSSINDFLNWVHSIVELKKHPIHLRQNIVSYPDYLSPIILTSHFSNYYFDTAKLIRHKADQAIDYGHISNWLSFADFLDSIGKSILTQQPNKNSQKRFLDFVQKSELKRGINFIEIYPEYSDFIDYCKRL